MLPAWAQDSRPAPPATGAAPAASALDALLFYQLMIAELELQNGRPRVAIEVLLDAGRRTKDDTLYQRAVDIALQARAPEQALAVTRAWRTGVPESTQALRYQVQILGAWGKPADAAEPLRAWLSRATPAERIGILASVPRIFVRGGEGRPAAEMIEQALQPYLGNSGPREAALVAIGRSWLLAGDDERALARARDAAKTDPNAVGPALLALELMQRQPAAEELVRARLAAPGVDPGVRLAYARVLTQQQRLADAAVQLEAVTQQQPDLPGPWLTLGAVELELRHPGRAEQALTRYLEVVARKRPDADEDSDDDTPAESVTQARLMLAQAAEQRKDYAAAERYLAAIQSPERAADVQTRRATLLVRQGRWRDGRELVRSLPATTPEQQRARLMAEVQVLREARQWKDAYDTLGTAAEQYPNDVELLYEQAMMADKLAQIDLMEKLLRRVIALKPDHQHAYNALGYALADRNQRLPEARELIQKALSLAPGDPFITDSLGWVAFRQGRTDEALQLLRQAYGARPDPEIGAHLGEVLWSSGARDEARRIWREARARDADNEVLLETLQRLKAGL